MEMAYTAARVNWAVGSRLPLWLAVLALSVSYGARSVAGAVAPSSRDTAGRAEWLRPEFYHFRGAAITVRVVDAAGHDDPRAARVSWGTGRARRSQYLRLPEGWWPTNRYGYAGGEALPCVLVWRAGRQRLLVVVAARASGVYDYRCPIVYRLRAGCWRQASSTKALQFSVRGSFDIRGRTLSVWDYEADWSRAHWAPQRYWLREFVWGRGGLRLWRSRTTRRCYEGFDAETDLRPRVSAEDDPLREFGLRWCWWGRRQYVPVP